MLDSQPILANGLGGLLLITTVFFGCLGLLIAALLEMAVFWLLLRRRFWRIAGVVLAANVLSAFIGGLPAALRTSMLKWDITTDPGSVYTHYWDGFLPLVLSLLGLTLLIEFICVLPLALRRWGGARISRLIAGTAVGNLLSYAVLVGIIYYLPPRGTGDFELLPDTSWVQSNTRVWYVDPDGARLCSIALDGGGRRIESETALKRLEYFPEPLSLYALVPGHHQLLYVDDEGQWRLREKGHERSLKDFSGGPVRYHLLEILPKLFPESIKHSTRDSERLDGVYFSGAVHYYHLHSQVDDREARTHLVPGMNDWGVTTEHAGQTLRFGIKHGLTQLFCRDPQILDDEDLIVFRCGAWIMVMDPVQRRVGQLVRGDNMVLETDYFTSGSVH